MSEPMPAPTAHPVMLVILDGFGWREQDADNAVRLAHKPHFDALWASCPHAFLQASGAAVGLPDGQFGNSEVGHTTIGAGRVSMQDLPRIDQAIQNGSIAGLPAMRDFIGRLRATRGTCHLMGLISTGGVHAHQDHALALARLLHAAEIPVILHAFTDGRDTAPRSGGAFMRTLLAQLPDGVRVGTVSGRYFALDRDNRWERVQRAYAAITDADAPRFDNALACIDHAYAADLGDEFIPPAAIGDYAGLRDGDGLLSFNYRADRVREIMAPFTDPAFAAFPRRRVADLAAVLGMTHYSDRLAARMAVLFPPHTSHDVLGEVVARAGRRQLRAAETEKYPHVTYFMNGGREEPFPGEDRLLVASPKVATYDLQPEMSAPELTGKVVRAIDGGDYDLLILNYANPDMVGHTGDLRAAIRAVETVDQGLGQIVAAMRARGGALLVTADHGNCEVMRDAETGERHTAHTTNRVPVLLSGGPDGVRLRDGGLADIAPTLLQLMQVPVPVAMTGRSLLDTP